jgi:hypothetical protein
VAIAARAQRGEYELQGITSAQRWQSVGEAHGDMQRLAALLRRPLTVRHPGLGVPRLPSRSLALPTMLTEVELELSNLATHASSSAS